MEKWKQRLADDDAEYAKQLELDVEIKTITEGANVRTRMKAKSAMADPISALAGARLIPYQQRLLDARALYSVNKDSEVLERFIKPIQICSTMDADKAAAVECAAQQYIKREIVKSAFTGGQFGENDRALWKIDGMGGAGNGTGMGPFVIANACIVHNPLADADDRYPNASLWSRTLPVDGLIFKNDVKKGGLHYGFCRCCCCSSPRLQRRRGRQQRGGG
jgi:hypothetical protein